MTRTFRHLSLTIFSSLALVSPAFGYLGSFEDADGYTTTGAIWDVTTYNAGQYGTANGGPGGGYGSIPQNTGLFYKYDGGDVSVNNGELIAHENFFHSGITGLVLRSSFGLGDTANDGANYVYSFDDRDFNGITPSTVTAGTVDIDYWSCPQTNLFASGRVTTTEFLNASGQTVFAIGTRGQEAFTADPIMEWYDGADWHDTGIAGNHSAWDHIMLSFNLDTDTVSFSFYSSADDTTYTFATDVAGAATLDSLKGIRFTGAPNTAKNAYDDFNIIAPIPIPEPGAILMALLGMTQCLAFRRRRA